MRLGKRKGCAPLEHRILAKSDCRRSIGLIGLSGDVTSGRIAVVLIQKQTHLVIQGIATLDKIGGARVLGLATPRKHQSL